ncbi:GntR family transcriptional regulator [Streptomyces sp. NPDC098781]|uniref:GntR family transcriptional regulator n=1 Tax=Streptomyces sp. NPDC098781 TaxID=3366097 RepID=UPI0038062EF5
MDEGPGGERPAGREVARLVTSLLHLIDTGAYPPGSVLPPQRRLAEEYGVSRDTVQRALHTLTAEGYVESRQGGGTRVLRTPRTSTPAPAGRTAEQVVTALLSRIVDGTYPPGAMLPTQRELAGEFGISRDTIQRALRELNSQGYVESRQGSGTRVLATPATRRAPSGGRFAQLGTHISAAFTSPTVTLDVFTLTSESLDTHIRLQMERTRLGEIRPESISVRLLLPRTDGDFKLARAVHDPEDRRMLDRLRQIAIRHTESIRHALRRLEVERLVSELRFECRESPVVPMQKLYLLNSTELITGYYRVVRRPVLLDDYEEIEVYDALGFEAALHHHSTADPQQLTIVNKAKQWFDHTWANAAPPRVSS